MDDPIENMPLADVRAMCERAYRVALSDLADYRRVKAEYGSRHEVTAAAAAAYASSEEHWRHLDQAVRRREGR